VFAGIMLSMLLIQTFKIAKVLIAASVLAEIQ
jgi:hypothetical protein